MYSFKSETKREFNEIGEKITTITETQFSYEDMEITELPKSCHSCPVGYMDHDCGRRIPLDIKERSPYCKLKLVSPI